MALTQINLWNDTTSIVGYDNAGTPTYYNSTWTSVGLSFDPISSAWNDTTLFHGQIGISGTDAYVIDSIMILGSYLRPAIAGTYTDQLRIAMVYGDGSGTSDLPGYYFTGMSDYGVDTLEFIDMLHDSLNNQAGVTTAPGSVVSYTFNLTKDDTATNFVRVYPVHLAVPAANFASASLGFLSGDPSYVPFDTVQYADGTMKHGQFMADVVFASDGSSAQFPVYSIADQTNGYFKREGSGDAGWGGNYIPNWAWSNATTGAASGLQYPYINYHVSCATCATLGTSVVNVANVKNITSVNAVPNPASNVVTINFSLASTSDVTVTVTDMLGNVVATQKANNLNNGKATVNTADYAAGVYMYTVTANGERATGRFVVAH